MSLNSTERINTAREIADNLELSGLSTSELRDRTGLSDDAFFDALAASGNPANVWLIRDIVEDAVRAAGKTPLPFTKLTDAMRPAAFMWFGYRRPEALKAS